MDILEETDVFLSACQLTQDESNNLVFNGITGCFESKYLADWFVNQINFGWKLWQAAKAQAVPDLSELQERIAGHQYYHDEHGHMIVDMDDVVKEIGGFDSWKAQAVPEGFVLVSAEQMSQWGHMANCAEEYGCPECYEARGYAHSLACEINAYFNVSEAQEPAND